jgi:hypothetical protein
MIMASRWYFEQDGERQGPVTGPQLRAMAKQGLVTPSTLVWREGSEEWVSASTISGLFDPAATGNSPTAGDPRVGGARIPDRSPSSAGASNRLPLADRILRAGFAIGRWVSIVIVLLAIIAIAISGFVLSTSLVPALPPEPDQPESPQFTTFVNQCRSEGGSSGNRLANGWMVRDSSPGTSELGTQRRSRSIASDPCAEHRVAIRDVLAYLKVWNRDGGPEDQLCDALGEFAAEERAWLMDGFVEFAKVWSGAEGRRGGCDASEAMAWYLTAATRAISVRDAQHAQRMEEYLLSEAERILRQTLSATVLGYSIAGLLVFLIIPLLIQIERNTRPESQRIG